MEREKYRGIKNKQITSKEKRQRDRKKKIIDGLYVF